MRLRNGTSPVNSRTPMTSAPGFLTSLAATRMMSSGQCCPSASAVTTPIMRGKRTSA
jgi:hypothetical protein